jgi:hypothetical protein
MKKDAQLKRLIDSGEIRTYIAAMNGENKNVTPKAMKNFQERLKSAGVRDANQNPIVADGGIGPQMRELGKKLKTEAAALPPPPVAAKPKRTAAVRLD